MWQLVAGCLGLWLYLVLMLVLFQMVGPSLVVVVGVVFAAGGLVILARTFHATYRRSTRPDWLWLPPSLVLAYLYLLYLQGLAWATRESFLGAQLDAALSLVAVPRLTEFVFPGAEDLALVFMESILVGFLLPPLVLVARGFECDETAEPEPAYLWYFHRRAFAELRWAVQAFMLEIVPFMAQTLARLRRWTIGHRFYWLLWPLFLVGVLALGTTALVAGSMVLVWLLAFVGGLCVLWLGAHYVALLVRGFERAVLKVRAGYVKCPHARCHEPLPLPVFRCPGCGQAHRLLLPGRYGILRRRCQCGESLPTLNWFGKQRLPAECRHCDQALAEEMFGANYHFPIYGGPDAGKSTFLAATVDELATRGLDELEIGWVLDRDRERFELEWQPTLHAGNLLAKTVDLLPSAFLLSVRAPGGLPASLYLYDPAGEALRDAATLEEHRFMHFASGLVLIVDPLSFPEIWREMKDAVPAQSIGLDPREVLDRIVTQMEELAGLSRDRQVKRPVAVVVTKVDLPAMAREVPAGSESTTVRAWLERRDAAFVHLLETRFRHLRFFAVTALERSEETGPHLLAPWAWLLSRQMVFSHPRLVRYGGTMLEAFAGLGLVAVGLLAPWALLLAITRLVVG